MSTNKKCLCKKMKINFKKAIIINILGSAVGTVRDEVIFVVICEDLGLLEVTVCVETASIDEVKHLYAASSHTYVQPKRKDYMYCRLRSTVGILG
jgi:hypothetical protein